MLLVAPMLPLAVMDDAPSDTMVAGDGARAIEAGKSRMSAMGRCTTDEPDMASRVGADVRLPLVETGMTLSGALVEGRRASYTALDGVSIMCQTGRGTGPEVASAVGVCARLSSSCVHTMAGIARVNVKHPFAWESINADHLVISPSCPKGAETRVESNVYGLLTSPA